MERTMDHDPRGSAAAQRVAFLREGGALRLPDAQGMATGVAAEVGHRAPCSPAVAANRVVASGIIDQIAADMIRINREIAARATPRPSFEDVLAKSDAKFVAMKGWGL